MIVHDFGGTHSAHSIEQLEQLMERDPAIPLRIEDVSKLPHPKEALLDVLCFALVMTADQKFADTVGGGAILLAQYQPGVGSAPLTP
jgi:hypothetical protein